MFSFFISHDMAVVKPRFSLRVIFRAKIPAEIHLPPLFLLDRTAVRSYSNSSPFRHTKALPLGELDAKRPERASPQQKDRCTAAGTSLCLCRDIAVPSLPPLHPRPLRLLCRHCPGCGTQHLPRCRLHPAGRGPNSFSLFTPLAAVVAVAPKGRGFSEKGKQHGTQKR